MTSKECRGSLCVEASLDCRDVKGLWSGMLFALSEEVRMTPPRDHE